MWARPFDLALGDLRMNYAAARFTSSGLPRIAGALALKPEDHARVGGGAELMGVEVVRAHGVGA